MKVGSYKQCFHSGDKLVYDNNWPVEKRAAELTGISLNGVASMATQKSADAFNLMIASGDISDITHDWYPSTTSFNDSLPDKVPGFNLQAMAPPASPSGRRLEEHRIIPVKPDGWAIGYTNEHPEETMTYFDFWFSDIGKRLSNFGVEGEQYEMVNGKPTFTQEVLTSADPVNAQMWGVGAQIPRGLPQDYEYQVQWTNQMGLDAIALYDKGDYLVDSFLGVSMTPEEQNV